MSRNLQSFWIRPIEPIVDYDFNEATREWELPCEGGEDCRLGNVLPATWMIGGELYGRKEIVALCDFHAAAYCRLRRVKMPTGLKTTETAEAVGGES